MYPKVQQVFVLVHMAMVGAKKKKEVHRSKKKLQNEERKEQNQAGRSLGNMAGPNVVVGPSPTLKPPIFDFPKKIYNRRKVCQSTRHAFPSFTVLTLTLSPISFHYTFSFLFSTFLLFLTISKNSCHFRS